MTDSPTYIEKFQQRKRSADNVADEIVENVVLMADRDARVYSYNGRHWERLTAFQLERLAFKYGGAEAARASQRSEICKLLALRVAIDEVTWGRVADHEISCHSGVLDLKTERVRSHTPDDYLEATLPHDFDPSAACPTWDRTIEDWFGSADDSRAAALQEFCGYIISSHARYKKAGLLEGPGDTGKSIAVGIAEQLVGRSSCCSLSVDSMDDPTRLTIIKGKMLNVMSELSSKALVKDSMFKTLISTEEHVFLNPKYEPPEMYLPICKHLIATNDLPRIIGRTAEIFNRLLIVPFNRVIDTDKQDPELGRRLVGEMRGIFAWAVRGAQALLNNRGQFTQPSGRERVLDEWRRSTNPLLDWLSESLVKASGDEPGRRHVLPLANIAHRARNRLGKTVTTVEVGKAARELGWEVKDARWSAERPVCKCIMDATLLSPVEGNEG